MLSDGERDRDRVGFARAPSSEFVAARHCRILGAPHVCADATARPVRLVCPPC
jgi:hypothetical protein